MTLETSHLLYKVAKSILRVDLASGSLYEELEKAGGHILRANQTYEAVLVNESKAGHFDSPTGGQPC